MRLDELIWKKLIWSVVLFYELESSGGMFSNPVFWAKSGLAPGGDGGDDGGRIFTGHPGPIPNVPRDKISKRVSPQSDM